MGPTASGKSALALEIAQTRPAVIINADAMQMVEDLRILTARPTPEEETQAPHALYGVLQRHEPTSVARWLALVAPIITHAWAQDKLPLLVGGTGMYVKALMNGLATVPPIPAAIRERIRLEDPETVRKHLETRDPATAAQLKPGDTQRNARALEVIEATGISLAEWQAREHAPLFPNAHFHLFAITPPRETLYPRIDQRFEKMLQQGALEEVQQFMATTRDLPPMAVPIREWCLTQPPIYRAHGVPELMAHLRGEIPLAEAITKGQQNTRNYAKRQLTWLRNQLPEAIEVKDAAQILVVLN